MHWHGLERRNGRFTGVRGRFQAVVHFQVSLVIWWSVTGPQRRINMGRIWIVHSNGRHGDGEVENGELMKSEFRSCVLAL